MATTMADCGMFDNVTDSSGSVATHLCSVHAGGPQPADRKDLRIVNTARSATRRRLVSTTLGRICRLVSRTPQMGHQLYVAAGGFELLRAIGSSSSEPTRTILRPVLGRSVPGGDSQEPPSTPSLNLLDATRWGLF